LQVVCAKKGAYATEVEAGKSYYWCTCGLSKNQVCMLYWLTWFN
jgi:CDGSH-type Zn-finger protein